MHSILTFGVVGGFVTLAHIMTGLFFHHIVGLSPFNANLVAYLVGFLLSYFGHRNITFRSKAHVSQSMPRFFVISGCNLIINQALVLVFSNYLGFPYWVSLAVMVAVVPTFTYVMSRIWAFSDGDFR